VREGRLVAVEDVASLGRKAVHHVEIEFAGPAPPGEFAALAGVGSLTATDHRLAFTVTGGLDAVVKAAARHEVVALTSHEPDLEDLFLAYYGESAGEGAGEGAPRSATAPSSDESGGAAGGYDAA